MANEIFKLLRRVSRRRKTASVIAWCEDVSELDLRRLMAAYREYLSAWEPSSVSPGLQPFVGSVAPLRQAFEDPATGNVGLRPLFTDNVRRAQADIRRFLLISNAVVVANSLTGWLAPNLEDDEPVTLFAADGEVLSSRRRMVPPEDLLATQPTGRNKTVSNYLPAEIVVRAWSQPWGVRNIRVPLTGPLLASNVAALAQLEPALDAGFVTLVETDLLQWEYLVPISRFRVAWLYANYFAHQTITHALYGHRDLLPDAYDLLDRFLLASLAGADALLPRPPSLVKLCADLARTALASVEKHFPEMSGFDAPPPDPSWSTLTNLDLPALDSTPVSRLVALRESDRDWAEIRESLVTMLRHAEVATLRGGSAGYSTSLAEAVEVEVRRLGARLVESAERTTGGRRIPRRLVTFGLGVVGSATAAAVHPSVPTAIGFGAAAIGAARQIRDDVVASKASADRAELGRVLPVLFAQPTSAGPQDPTREERQPDR